MLTIDWILRTMGIYPHRCGYAYIKDMVEATYDTNDTTMKPLYEKVSKMHNVPVYSINNGIKKACEASFKSKKQLNLNIILNANACDETRALTNSEIVFFISNFMKRDSYDKSRDFVEVYEEFKALWR